MLRTANSPVDNWFGYKGPWPNTDVGKTWSCRISPSLSSVCKNKIGGWSPAISFHRSAFCRVIILDLIIVDFDVNIEQANAYVDSPELWALYVLLFLCLTFVVDFEKEQQKPEILPQGIEVVGDKNVLHFCRFWRSERTTTGWTEMVRGEKAHNLLRCDSTHLTNYCSNFFDSIIFFYTKGVKYLLWISKTSWGWHDPKIELWWCSWYNYGRQRRIAPIDSISTAPILVRFDIY